MKLNESFISYELNLLFIDFTIDNKMFDWSFGNLRIYLAALKPEYLRIYSDTQLIQYIKEIIEDRFPEIHYYDYNLDVSDRYGRIVQFFK